MNYLLLNYFMFVKFITSTQTMLSFCLLILINESEIFFTILTNKPNHFVTIENSKYITIKTATFELNPL